MHANDFNAWIISEFFGLTEPRDVARLLDLEYSRLIYHIYKVPDHKKYTVFSIKKRDGTERKITVPVTPIKIIQRKLNFILQIVYSYLYPNKPVHGFVHGRDMLTNAQQHLNKTYVFNLDLEDFFSHIHFGRVRGMFMAKPYNLPGSVATILAQICCTTGMSPKNNKETRLLPQGAPTSPIISNMVCAKMDSELNRLAKKYNCTYSRYADDITFSTHLLQFPKAIAKTSETGRLLDVGEELKSIIVKNGFEINFDKVRLKRYDQRQMVTGIIVNTKKPNLPRKYKNQIRAMIHVLGKFGEEGAEKEFRQHYKKQRNPTKKPPSFKQVLQGKLVYYAKVRGVEDPLYYKFRNQLRRLAPEMKLPKTQLDKLEDRYKDIEKIESPQKRGREFEKFIEDLFRYFNIKTDGSFVRKGRGAQVDGTFWLGDLYYYVECKWEKEPCGVDKILGLKNKISHSQQVVGLFISVNGWTQTLIEDLERDAQQRKIILMNGEDLDFIFSGDVSLKELLQAKRTHLLQHKEPYLSAGKYLKTKNNKPVEA